MSAVSDYITYYQLASIF